MSKPARPPDRTSGPPVPAAQAVPPAPAKRRGLVRLVGGFFVRWWDRKGPVVLALVDDFLLYTCFIVFVSAVHLLLRLAGTYLDFGDAEMHKEIHKWGFLACDVIIVAGLARKLFFTLLLGDHR